MDAKHQKRSFIRLKMILRCPRAMIFRRESINNAKRITRVLAVTLGGGRVWVWCTTGFSESLWSTLPSPADQRGALAFRGRDLVVHFGNHAFGSENAIAPQQYQKNTNHVLQFSTSGIEKGANI